MFGRLKINLKHPLAATTLERGSQFATKSAHDLASLPALVVLTEFNSGLPSSCMDFDEKVVPKWFLEYLFLKMCLKLSVDI